MILFSGQAYFTVVQQQLVLDKFIRTVSKSAELKLKIRKIKDHKY